MKLSYSIFTVLFAVIIFSGNSFAQDAVKVDPKHYKVEFENDQVRTRIAQPGKRCAFPSRRNMIFLSDAMESSRS
jgi:hypothetical protein